MSEMTTVTCDGGDCYEQIHDCDSASAHDADGYDRPGFVTAHKRIKWSEAFPGSTADDDLMGKISRWETYCRECAILIDWQKRQEDGWEVRFPEGYVEGKVCPDCFHAVCPSMQDNGQKPWTGSGKTFASNPDFKQWPCETCEQTGYLVHPIIDTRKSDKPATPYGSRQVA